MKRCNYCASFFGDDSIPAPDCDVIYSKVRESLFPLWAVGIIEEDGNLVFALLGDDWKVVGKKRIRYCPMCGKRLVR